MGKEVLSVLGVDVGTVVDPEPGGYVFLGLLGDELLDPEEGKIGGGGTDVSWCRCSPL